MNLSRRGCTTDVRWPRRQETGHGTYDFLIETYSTERLKTLGVWAQIPDGRMEFRSEPRARTPLEHMVHQCMSEDAWMKALLGISVALPVLPAEETRLAFLIHYADTSQERLASLSVKPDSWFEETAQFFDVVRSRAWISCAASRIRLTIVDN